MIEKLFYFDIETTGRFSSVEQMQDIDKNAYDTFVRKYKKMKHNKTPKWFDVSIEDAYRNQSPLLPEWGIIICISYGFIHPATGDFILKTIKINDFDNYKEFLQEIAKVFDKVNNLNLIPCGHNIKGFDVPFIVKHFMMNGITIPKSLYTYNKKPWEVNFVDTAEVWKGLAWSNTSLDEVTYCLGVPSPKEDIYGGEVFEVYWNDKDIDRIVKYCENDVKALLDICKKMFQVL